MTSSRLKAVRVRAMTQADVHEVSELEAEVWGDAGATPSMLSARLQNYPEGNLLAVATDGKVCGYAAFCLINYEEYSRTPVPTKLTTPAAPAICATLEKAYAFSSSPRSVVPRNTVSA